MRCATHPDVETKLACSKCGKPICPKCMVETPVGFRCPTCARGGKLPTFQLTTMDFVKAGFTGAGVGVACGIVWLLVRMTTPYLDFFSLFIAAGAGFGIGELMSRSVNRKRGIGLKIVAGFCFVVAYLVGNQLTTGGQLIMVFNLFNLLAIAAGVYMAASRL